MNYRKANLQPQKKIVISSIKKHIEQSNLSE